MKDTRKARLDELVKFMPMGLPPLNAQLNGGRKTTEEMKQEYTKFLDGSYVEPVSYYYSVVSSDDSVSYSQLTAYPTDGGFYVFANGAGINGNDNVVLKIVFKGDKNGFPIFVQDLELSHGDGGGIVDLPNTTDLNSVVEPGNYFVNGTDKWSSLGYPFSVAVGNKVVMSVSTVRSGKFDTVCQTFFATNLSFKPGPHARILTDAGWSIWDGTANFSYLDVNFVKTPVMEQLDLKISEAIGDKPTLYSYKKPVNDGTGPNIEFTPSANPGVVISLPQQIMAELHIPMLPGLLCATVRAAGHLYLMFHWRITTRLNRAQKMLNGRHLFIAAPRKMKQMRVKMVH
ncbi:pyocin knob domain-containing protein [Serratia sarumanii]|uniref:pyocin knob domain-containing protein n=1 Tax=Serratia sarumanii TaxID=3020826 RepID=UPI003F7DF1B5